MTTANEYRLPIGVRPIKYSISLTPDLVRFTFTGEESIDIEVEIETDTITINACELDISTASVLLKNGRTLNAKQISLDDEFERALRTE